MRLILLTPLLAGFLFEGNLFELFLEFSLSFFRGFFGVALSVFDLVPLDLEVDFFLFFWVSSFTSFPPSSYSFCFAKSYFFLFLFMYEVKSA